MKKENAVNKKFTKGFTLLELLVVVLIIGILAAVAVPQYKMAVGKAQFSTLKNITRSLTESAQRYYLANNIYPRKVADLDIDFNITKEYQKHYGLQIITSDGIDCTVWDENNQNYVACGKKIFGETIMFYMKRDERIPAICIAFSTDKNDAVNRLCQKETGRTGHFINSSYYSYYY